MRLSAVIVFLHGALAVYCAPGGRGKSSKTIKHQLEISSTPEHAAASHGVVEEGQCLTDEDISDYEASPDRTKVAMAFELLEQLWGQQVTIESAEYLSQSAHQIGLVEFGSPDANLQNMISKELHKTVCMNAIPHLDCNGAHANKRASELIDKYGNCLTAMALISNDEYIQEAAVHHMIELEGGDVPCIKYFGPASD